MSVKLRPAWRVTKKRPYYRIVVMDSRAPRDGRTIDEVGYYHPIETEDKQILIKEDKVKEWLSKGARPTITVKRLLNRNNITIK